MLNLVGVVVSVVRLALLVVGETLSSFLIDCKYVVLGSWLGGPVSILWSIHCNGFVDRGLVGVSVGSTYSLCLEFRLWDMLFWILRG